jgi:hypothetical protein
MAGLAMKNMCHADGCRWWTKTCARCYPRSGLARLKAASPLFFRCIFSGGVAEASHPFAVGGSNSTPRQERQTRKRQEREACNPGGLATLHFPYPHARASINDGGES